jgi:hypothetical protein
VADARSSTAHDAHDLLLIAALVDRDLHGADHDRAREQVATCSACAALHADLLGLARAVHDLPGPDRPRDFTLRPDDAQRLRPGLVRRLLGVFGTARDGVSRPLAMGLTTLGLAGLLIGVVPGALSSGASTATLNTTGAPVEDQRFESFAMPAASQAPQLQGEGAGAPAATDAQDVYRGAPPPAGPDVAAEHDPAGLAPDASGTSLTVVLSGTFLIVGLGLFALRWTSRRFGG